jgi:signal transduction histidine kinase
MKRSSSSSHRSTPPRRKTRKDFQTLSRHILRRANRNASRIGFLKEVSEMLLEFSGCDALELWLREEEDYFRCRSVLCLAGSYHFHVLPRLTDGHLGEYQHTPLESALARLSWDLIRRRYDSESPGMTERGGFFSGRVARDLVRIASQDRHGNGTRPAVPDPPNGSDKDGQNIQNHASEGGDYHSVALLPLQISHLNTGILWLKSRRPDAFTHREIELYEDSVEVLTVTLLNQRARAALRERVKEMTCLYRIAKADEQPNTTMGQLLLNIAELLPPAWQYPELTSARIVIDGKSYETNGFWDGQYKQSAKIVIDEKERGVVEVVYSGHPPELDEGPFLKEERTLLDNVARQVAMIVEQREAEEQRAMLEGQLRHADRLATIGQLAAGVAHELNEPLGNILGFAQLVQQESGLSGQTRKDVDTIVAASLHAREIVNKLKLFARQSPPQKTQLDLNELIEKGLVFVESRCAKAGIEIVRSLADGLPAITADHGQIHQVLVNLVVNAVQAMPQGGRLIIATRTEDDSVFMTVEDTGVGMSEEVRRQIFVPFFTTKDINKGTGLGLAVVDGIVNAHSGHISVESREGEGSRFVIRLPIGELSPEKED